MLHRKDSKSVFASALVFSFLSLAGIVQPLGFAGDMTPHQTGVSVRPYGLANAVNTRSNGDTITVAAGDDLQAAIDSAKPGDVIMIEAGASYVGNFTLPKKRGSDWIIIRSTTPDSELPSGRRVTPSDAPLMPKLITPNADPVIRTDASAHNYWFIGIEFGMAPDQRLSYSLLALGDGTSAQSTLDVVPYDLVVDRCYIHGNPTADLMRGINLNSASTSIIDSYISECHGIGFDTQAILGYNGPGPYRIINNYLEGSGENVMFGGADPKIPGLVPSDIEIRRNHFVKPLRWKEGIIAKPAEVTAAVAEQAGDLAAGTFYYRVAARGPAGYDTTATSAASDEVAVSVPAGQGAVTLSWTPSAYAEQYRIYRTTEPPDAAARTWVHYTSTDPSFTDVGDTLSVATGRTPPEVGTLWTVKNLFELKNARRVTVDGNLFENSWVHAQTGFAILLKSANQEGTAPWSVTEDVTISNNIIRHTAGGVSLLGRQDGSTQDYTKRITIYNNLFVDIGSADVGGVGRLFEIASGPASQGQMIGPVDVRIDHNTAFQTEHIILASAYSEADKSFGTKPGFVFTNNIVMHNRYGVFGDNGGGVGNPALRNYFPSSIFKKNIIIGGQGSTYPKKNYFPPTIEGVGFVDSQGGNYRLAGSSPYKRAGIKDKDIGADLDMINMAMGTTQLP